MLSRVPVRVFAVLVLISASLVYALSSGPAQSAQQAPTQAEKTALSDISAFQRAATPEDVVPGETWLTGTIRRVGPVSSARRVWGSVSPTQVYVQVGDVGTSACASPERITQEPLVVSVWQGAGALSLNTPPTPEEWAGLVVDDVEDIEVQYADGAHESVPVVSNGFYFRSSGREVAQLSWKVGGVIHTYGEEG